MYIDFSQITSSELKDTKYQLEEGGTYSNIEFWGPLNRINIFVGANNSGKSRFIRGLLKEVGFIRTSIQINLWREIDKISDLITSILDQATPGLILYITPSDDNADMNADKYSILFLKGSQKRILFNINYLHELRARLKSIAQTKTADVAAIAAEIKEYAVILEIVDFVIASKYEKYPLISGINVRTSVGSSLGTEASRGVPVLLTALQNLDKACIRYLQLNRKIYVPVLRTSTKLHFDGPIPPTDLFATSVIKNNFNNAKSETIDIVTGLGFYSSFKRIRNSRREIRKGLEEFEQFLADYFFDGDPDFEIVAHDSGKSGEQDTLMIHLKKEERYVHELGDGIQALMILMYPIFIAPQDSWVCIEEPELNLHPGMQRIFLEVLQNNAFIKAKNLTFFFPTHSNHLLDLTLESNDTSIFKFVKRENGDKPIHIIKNVKSGDIDILTELGVNNSSVFMSNCSIWVEGVTDRKYIRAFLNAFIESSGKEHNFQEDIHYSFFEYSGSNVSHYLFGSSEEGEEMDEGIIAQFLNNRIFLVADLDRDKEPKHFKLKDSEGKNFQYYPLKVLEVENLLSRVQYEKLLPKLSKKITKPVDLDGEKLKREPIGSYLDKCLKLSNLKLSGESGGTLKTFYKNRLADLVTINIEWSEMTPEAQDLAQSVYEFIQAANSN